MRLALGRKITIAVAAFGFLLLVFLNLSQWYLYVRMKSFAEERVSQDLLAIAESTARRAGSLTDGLLAGESMALDQYAGILLLLDEVRDINELMSLNIYNPDGLDFYDESDSIQTDEILHLSEFVSASAGIPAVTQIYRSDSLYLLTAYAPVTDLTDSVIAVIGAEAGYEFFSTIDDFRRNIIAANAVSAGLVVLFVFAFLVINRKLLETQQALLRASAISSMGEMAATIAHEIRNPLGIIKNSAERIKKKYAADSQDPIFDFISDEVARLNSVVSGYLDFVHPVSERRERVDLRETIETLVSQTRADFRDARISVRMKCEPDDGLFSTQADRFAIRQALLNLMLNARDAQPDGGGIEIILTKGDGNIRIEIADEGHGIKKKDIERVLEPFVTTREKGSGLGLYVAKNVAEAHAGRLTLRSKPGKGTIATLTLPAGD
jgi:signal transduction histidine kinase